MLRGSLLHHNYTMGLSRQAEPDSLVAYKPVGAYHNLGRSVQNGIYHVVNRKQASVGDSLFTDISSARVSKTNNLSNDTILTRSSLVNNPTIWAKLQEYG